MAPQKDPTPRPQTEDPGAVTESLIDELRDNRDEASWMIEQGRRMGNSNMEDEGQALYDEACMMLASAQQVYEDQTT